MNRCVRLCAEGREKIDVEGREEVKNLVGYVI